MSLLLILAITEDLQNIYAWENGKNLMRGRPRKSLSELLFFGRATAVSQQHCHNYFPRPERADASLRAWSSEPYLQQASLMAV